MACAVRLCCTASGSDLVGLLSAISNKNQVATAPRTAPLFDGRFVFWRRGASVKLCR